MQRQVGNPWICAGVWAVNRLAALRPRVRHFASPRLLVLLCEMEIVTMPLEILMNTPRLGVKPLKCLAQGEPLGHVLVWDILGNRVGTWSGGTFVEGLDCQGEVWGLGLTSGGDLGVAGLLMWS